LSHSSIEKRFVVLCSLLNIYKHL